MRETTGVLYRVCYRGRSSVDTRERGQFWSEKGATLVHRSSTQRCDLGYRHVCMRSYVAVYHVHKNTPSGVFLCGTRYCAVKVTSGVSIGVSVRRSNCRSPFSVKKTIAYSRPAIVGVKSEICSGTSPCSRLYRAAPRMLVTSPFSYVRTAIQPLSVG